MKDLPPIRAVRVFEACYRMRNFTRAGKSLNVGQPAVSHQIKLLEQDLNTRLFERNGPNIVPTPAADRLYAIVSRALGEIAEASREIRAQTTPRDGLMIEAGRGIASSWLAPRIAALREAHPELPVRVISVADDREINFEGSDCALLLGDGHWESLETCLLLKETVIPMAAPALAERVSEYSPEQLLSEGPLIHLEDPEGRWFVWEDWRKAYAPTVSEMDRTVTVSNYGLAIHQAVRGDGVVLAWSALMSELAETGALVPVQDKPLVSERGYWIVAKSGFLSSDPGLSMQKLFSQVPS